jgi:glycosyltransferase involved in cell wall biosynthesis
MHKSKILYIYSEQPDYVRVDKVLDTLSDLDASFFYVGCLRGGQSKRKYRQRLNLTYHMANLNIPHGGVMSALKTLFFLFYSIYKVAIIKPDLIIAVNEELALPFVILFPRVPVICEAYDSLSMRAKKNSVITAYCLKKISRFVLSRCTGLIEVSEERLQAHVKKPKNYFIVPNSLKMDNDSNNTRIHNHIKKIVKKNSFIFVSGSFSDNINGIEQLLDSIEFFNGKLTVIAAGRPNGEWVNKVFINHRFVNYIGTVTPQEAFYLASQSKGIFAYYKPISELYRFAAPNKIFDAMAVGIPILINSDCKASEFANKRGFALTSKYDDKDTLVRNLGDALNETYSFNKDSLMKSFVDSYEWTVVSKKYKEMVYSILDKNGQ